MRQSQKTEQQADRLSRLGLENRKVHKERVVPITVRGKGIVSLSQDLVLDRITP